MIDIKGMLEIHNFYAEELSAHQLRDLSGEYSQDTQHVLLWLKFDLRPVHFMLVDLLVLLPRVLLLASLEGAVLSLFASPSTHHWYLLLGFPCSQVALGGQVQRVHMTTNSNCSTSQTKC